MGGYASRRRVGRHGSDLQSIEDVQRAVMHLIWKQYSGLSTADQQDLQQIVMLKYFGKFGRDRLPDDDDGNPAVPIGWLILVVRNAGIDADRARKARPADPADFLGDDQNFLDLLMLEDNPEPSLSSAVAVKIDTQRALIPALKAFGQSNPQDLKLIVWRYVEGREVDAIAKKLGKSPDAAKIAIRRALDRLRQLIKQTN